MAAATMSTSPSVGAPAGNDARGAVAHLITRASTYPCSAAPAAFSRLAQNTSSTFQLALDALLPILDTQKGEVSDRILVSFILFALYAPHPIAINPFKSALIATFVVERDKSLVQSNTGSVADNEPLVWVLWKILKGDGDDIGPYSPSALAHSLLPPDLRASNLILDESLYSTNDIDNLYDTQMHRMTPIPGTPAPFISTEKDAENAAIAQAMRLLLAARNRVLTLSEQRQLVPHLTTLVATPLITQSDLASLSAHNPNIAAPLFAAFLSGPASGTHAALTALCDLPPTLPTFDLFGRLLRDETPLSADGPGPAFFTVGALVTTEVLGVFIAQSINTLEMAERAEREGRVSIDLFAQGVQHLCRFYHSLCKLNLVDVTNDVETAAMTHFSLVHARFEEANALYRTLIAGRGVGIGGGDGGFRGA
ncbi:hypothetical protein MIND_00629600 [Mycena indigotica]|uniref:CCR4-NOT transcription complex subunit 11 n=1 Tax=Mycena indigotica TaxID=2126181 RepID=A0A8H6SSP9_9AGAR|nr:uncharacterized protein MIND_00629600 [Mycena indigotica]KAF7303986.1 hypothetical protein MIND_00629600 [Mycena indigotica]